ncbi:thioredoxin [Bradyrhizobium diazoefficiens]
MTIIDQGNGAAGPAAADLIKDTTTQTFVKDVIEESKRQPVLIDFWAEWCGPCKQLTPVLEKAVKAAKGKVKLVKMNIDQHPAIPGQMGIQSIPAVIAFVNGQPADGFMGAVPESQLNAFIEKLTKGVTAPGEPNIAEILQEAEAVLAEGDAAAAAQIYAEVLSHDSTNIAALAGLAKCYTVSGAMEQAKQTLAMVPESKRNDPAVKAVQTAIDLAEQAEQLGPVAELEQKVAANPLDHQARFDLATALNRAGQPGSRDRAAARDHQARPQMERRRRPQAARAVLRGLGRHGRCNRRGAQAPVDHPLFVGARLFLEHDLVGIPLRNLCQRGPPAPDHALARGTSAGTRCRSTSNIAGPPTFRRSFRYSHCRARSCCRAAKCRSTSSSRAISRWSMIPSATAIA